MPEINLSFYNLIFLEFKNSLEEKYIKILDEKQKSLIFLFCQSLQNRINFLLCLKKKFYKYFQ